MRSVGPIALPPQRRHRAHRDASPPVPRNAPAAVACDAAVATDVVAVGGTGNCAADAEASLLGCAAPDC